MKILFTGGSSFTGFWFVQALAKAGHAVTATLTQPPAAYTGIRRHRVDQLAAVAKIAPGVKFGSPEFLRLMEQPGSFDLLCHHAADVTNYNSPDFDASAALAGNTANLRATLAGFKAQGGRAVLLTGSVFEADEGAGDEPRMAFNPYGLSKTMTAQAFRYYAAAAGLGLGKFVIPNPFGPWEEPRFTAYLIKTWRGGAVAEVKTPDYVRDNIPVDLLAACYSGFAARVAAGGSGFLRLNPSGYAESQGAFTERFAAALRPRLGWACGVKLAQQTDFSQPLRRINTDSARPLVPEWSEERFWDACAEYYRTAPST